LKLEKCKTWEREAWIRGVHGGISGEYDPRVPHTRPKCLLWEEMAQPEDIEAH